LNCPN